MEAKGKSGLVLAALGFTALVWLMSLAYGFQYLVAESSRLLYFRAATIPFAAIVAGLTWYALARKNGDGGSARFPWWLGLATMSVSFALSCFFYSAKLAPLPWVAPVIALPVVAALCHHKWGYRGANRAFLAGAMALFVYLVLRVPHDSGGDMLQIIEFASRDMLAGENPFRPYSTVSGKDVPFGYWPGTWLPYLPLVALGIDVRIVNLLAVVALALLFGKASDDPHAPDVLALTFYPFILSSPALQMVLHGHLWVYWLSVCATLLLVARERYLAAAVLFGFCLASRPTALFLAGPIAAYVWTRTGPRWVLVSAAIAVAVALAINAPFALVYGPDFWNNSYGRLVGFGQELVHFSLAGYLIDAGLSPLIKPLQVVVMLLAIGGMLFKKSVSRPRFVMLTGTAFVWMILLNSYATRYVYFPGFLLMALGLVLAYSGTSASAGGGRQTCP